MIEETVAREYGTAASSSPPEECAVDGHEEFRDEPVHDQEQREAPSAISSRGGPGGNSAVDTQPRRTTVEASRCSREPGRVSGELSAGCVEHVRSDERRTALTQPPEPTLATSSFRKPGCDARVDSDGQRTVDGEILSTSSCTELGAQAAEALLLSELSKEGAMMVGETEYDEGIGVEDWLDVTHAMLDTSVLGLDLD